MTQPVILVIGTLDTKGLEIEYLRGRIEEFGAQALVLDSGILGEPIDCARAEIAREDVARAAGMSIDEVRAAGSRGAAVEIMQRGIRAITVDLWSRRALHGVVCLGGAEGALLGASAMHVLPVGVPKVLVSPSASGRRPFAPFVGTKDVMVMHSVIDILGVNPISRVIFDNAASAIVGMVLHAGKPMEDLPIGTVGVTMLGQTTPGVMLMREVLARGGIDTVIFHANGVGGVAMEELIEAHALGGVIEYSLSELANSVKGGIHAVGPSRLTVAGARGLPQVIVPGCVDFFNQGAPDTLPEEYRSRKTYYHNPVATLVRLVPDEMAELGQIIATRLSMAKGPVAVVIPTQGFSLSDRPGGDLWDPDADRAFVDALRNGLAPHVRVSIVEGNANDASVAEAAASEYLAMTNTIRSGGPGGTQVLRTR